MIDATEIGEIYLSPPVCHEQDSRKESEKMRAWLYCRVTNGWDADSKDHLALQKAELERFCAEHDFTVAGTTMDTGSGKKELQELVHSGVEQDAYDVLVGISAARFGGDTLSLLQMGKALTEQDKGICVVRENISTHPDIVLQNASETLESQEMGGQTL